MAEVIGTTDVKKCRRNHVCTWCGDTIDKGQPYTRWAWVDGSTFDTVKVHPECRDAWHDVAEQEGGYYETMPYEHERGSTECR